MSRWVCWDSVRNTHWCPHCWIHLWNDDRNTSAQWSPLGVGKGKLSHCLCGPEIFQVLFWLKTKAIHDPNLLLNFLTVLRPLKNINPTFQKGELSKSFFSTRLVKEYKRTKSVRIFSMGWFNFGNTQSSHTCIDSTGDLNRTRVNGALTAWIKLIVLPTRCRIPRVPDWSSDGTTRRSARQYGLG